MGRPFKGQSRRPLRSIERVTEYPNPSKYRSKKVFLTVRENREKVSHFLLQIYYGSLRLDLNIKPVIRIPYLPVEFGFIVTPFLPLKSDPLKGSERQFSRVLYVVGGTTSDSKRFMGGTFFSHSSSV